jgi:REP element-mobilizing transposase RayT
MRHAENRGVDAAPTTMTEQPRGRDLRKGRHSQPSQIYLLTSVSHQRRPVFADFHLGRIVVKAMRHHDLTGHTETLAYVVMPDHFHWMISLGDRFDLPRLMASLKGYTARCIKEQIDLGDDPLWQAGYHDHALRRDEDVQAAARYIVANPLRAGLVERLGDYPLWDAVWL